VTNAYYTFSVNRWICGFTDPTLDFPT